MAFLHLKAPDVAIMMDSASFIFSAPSGDLTPSVAEAPPPRMLPWKVGSAFRLGGGGTELDYGRPNTDCFYAVILCPNGLIVSLWVNFYASTTVAQMIVDGSAFYSETRGMSIFQTGGGVSRVNIFHDNTQYKGWTLYEDLFHWQNIVFTWNVSINILLYLDGCSAYT